MSERLDVVTDERMDKYLDITARALAKAVIAPPERSFNRRLAESYLDMVNASDEVHVGGNFLEASSYSYSDLTAGTMYIGGDFRQLNGIHDTNFNASGSHKVVFNGSGRQSIWFASTDSGFGRVSFENPDVVIGNRLRGFTLCEDMTLVPLSGSLTMTGSTELEGHDLTISGDLVSTSETNLGGGTLKVTGTLYQQGGTMTVNTGKLDIGGNYYLAGEGSNFEEGHEVYKSCDSYLNMRNENDEVRVGGNFATAALYSSSLTAGTMYIGGDFRQATTNNANNFNASGSHKVVFNGNERQGIRFDSNSSGFQDVRFENPDIELKGKALRGFTLKDDISLTLSTRELNMYGTMDLNGHSIGIGTIEGDFTVSGGIVDLKGKDVEIKGDLIATSNIDLGGGNLKVTGTLYQQSGKMTVAAAMLSA